MNTVDDILTRYKIDERTKAWLARSMGKIFFGPDYREKGLDGCKKLFDEQKKTFLLLARIATHTTLPREALGHPSTTDILDELVSLVDAVREADRADVEQEDGSGTGGIQWNKCCRRSFGVTKLRHYNGNTMVGTFPVAFGYCTECGTKIRPEKECCRDSMRQNFKYCPTCGDCIQRYKELREGAT